MSRISVLIPDADAGMSLPVAYCLKESGQVKVHGSCARPSKPLELSNLFTSLDYAEQKGELESWLNRIDEIAAMRRVDVILPTSNAAIRALSTHRHKLASRMKLAFVPDPTSLDTATNKALLTGFLTDRGIPQPPTVVVSAGAQRPEGLFRLRFPVLVKPPTSRGGAGIKCFGNMQELSMFFAGESKSKDWVVQELVEGTDLCVNVLCRSGEVIASTVQHAIVSSSNAYEPAVGFEFRDGPAAMRIVRKLFKELNWSGIANIDMRLDTRSQTPLVLEVNGRYWLSLLGSLNANVNFPLLASEAVVGSLKSNLRAREARYFRGKGYSLLALVGGGRYGARPSETDLNYFLTDPLPSLAAALGAASKTLSGSLFGRASMPACVADNRTP